LTASKTINWGIMGPGVIARKMARALALIPEAKLVAAASKTPGRAQAFAEEYGVEQALTYEEIVRSPEIDIIYVATTHNFHYENARLALAHGKHVLMEKPFTVNAAEARELVELAKKKNRFLMEAMWVRYLPSIRRLKQEVGSGVIGALKQLKVNFGGFVKPWYEGRLKDPDLAGGVTLDIKIYPISFVCNLLQELPSEIKSMSRFSDRGVDELANYLFRFPSGAFANISTSFNLKMINRAEIYGSEGYIEFPNFMDGEAFTIYKHGGSNDDQETIEVTEPNHENGFIYQAQEVVRCLQSGKTESDIMPLAETVGLMRVMDKMRHEWGFKYPFEK